MLQCEERDAAFNTGPNIQHGQGAVQCKAERYQYLLHSNVNGLDTTPSSWVCTLFAKVARKPGTALNRQADWKNDGNQVLSVLLPKDGNARIRPQFSSHIHI